MSWRTQMCGWFERGDGPRLLLETAAPLGVRGAAGRQHLDGDVRPRRVSRALYTSPMPPAPRRRGSRTGPGGRRPRGA